MKKQRVLTGITTTGTPHLGNYVGAIRPAIAASLEPDVQSFYFLADLHSMIKSQDAAALGRSTREIAATWLALGLDTERVVFYRQSDVPEITELTWMLTCMTAKGLMNRAHAYKAAVQANQEAGQDDDFGITMGLYSYPVLMAADILMFNADRVPVGRDQIQHVEMARDIAQRFNHHYGEHFVLPAAVVDEHVAVLQGLDGRKMSKSYGNTIPLFLPEKQLQKHINRIKTNLQEPGRAQEPRRVDGVPGLGGLRDAGAARADAPRVRERHRLGRGQAPAVRAGQRRAARAARALRGADGAARPDRETAARGRGARARLQPAVHAGTACRRGPASRGRVSGRGLGLYFGLIAAATGQFGEGVSS